MTNGPVVRWRPDMEDRTFATQAATLYTTYHLVQILIYRPFSQMAAYLPPDGRADAVHATAVALVVRGRKRPFPFPADSSR